MDPKDIGNDKNISDTNLLRLSEMKVADLVPDDHFLFGGVHGKIMTGNEESIIPH